MSSSKFYYAHVGTEFNGLAILGLCCVLKDAYYQPPEPLFAFLPLDGLADPNVGEKGFIVDALTTRRTFAYRLIDGPINVVFVEADDLID